MCHRPSMPCLLAPFHCMILLWGFVCVWGGGVGSIGTECTPMVRCAVLCRPCFLGCHAVCCILCALQASSAW